jgi:hypothetical protein
MSFEMTGDTKKQIDTDEPVPLAVESPVLARWLGVTGKQVYELGKAGIAVRAGHDRYYVEASVRRYCEHLRQNATQR